jgi:hypothetical protein
MFKRRVYLLILSISWNASSGADVYRFVDTSGDSFYAGDSPAIKVNPKNTGHDKGSLGIMPSYPYSDFLLDGMGEQTARILKFREIVEREAQIAGIDPEFLHSVINAESAFDPLAVSQKGALGLMQLMPATIERFGVDDPYDPAQNIKGGAKYLSLLMGKFDSDLTLVLAAYNAGESRVLRYGRKLPPLTETRSYVSKVLKNYNERR